jgi:molybdate transport system substrate-binding protein
MQLALSLSTLPVSNMSMRLSSSLIILLLSFFCSKSFAQQNTLTIAAASDLSSAEPMLTAAFEKTNPSIRVRFVNGASAALAQQIQQGAPFDAFLSANVVLVDQLQLASPKTYAVGHVAMLWKDSKPHPLNDLAGPGVRFMALPNPKLAPYGLAAKQVLQRAGLWDKIQLKIVYAENVRQALELFDSGNADAVLTSASLIINRHPQILPSEVLQKGGIVPATKMPEAAQKFLDWLVSPPAQQILATFGFDKPTP